MERIYAFLVDVDSLLSQRDNHFRTIRAIEAESAVMARSALPQFEKEKEQALEANRVAAMQADESMRVAYRFLQQITGLDQMDDIRRRVTTIRAALKRYNEAQYNVEDSQLLTAMVKETDDPEYVEQLKRLSESHRSDETHIKQYIEGLVPGTYSPQKNLLS